MCRYAVHQYKPHFACFACRKSFKRRLISDWQRGAITKTEAVCPQCGALMANMGKDFAAPKQSDKKSWMHLQTLYSVGIAFHSCGCSGPGYIPKDEGALALYFEEQIAAANLQLSFWREREEPQDQRQRQSENDRHGHHLQKLPNEIRGKDVISNSRYIKTNTLA
jgi:hypothetical protein